MRYIYRFLQLLLLLLTLSYVAFAFSERGGENAWSAHFITLAIFIGLIVSIEYVIRTNYSTSREARLDAFQLSKPLELKFSKSYMLFGLAVIIGLIFISIKMFEESRIYISIICIGLIIFLYRYGHHGDIGFWNRRIARIDSRGISHYKYGFISWGNVREIDQRQIKAGKILQIRLADSIKPNRSNFYKKWEGILFSDTRLIVLPISFLDKPNDLIVATIENFFRRSSGVDMAVIKQQQSEHEKLVKMREQAKSRKASHDEISLIDKKILSSLRENENSLSELVDDMGDEKLKSLYQARKSIEDERNSLLAGLESNASVGDMVGRAGLSESAARAEKIPKLLKEQAEIHEKNSIRKTQIQNAKTIRGILVIVVVVLIYGLLKYM